MIESKSRKNERKIQLSCWKCVYFYFTFNILEFCCDQKYLKRTQLDSINVYFLSIRLPSFLLFIFVSYSICNNTRCDNKYHYMTTAIRCRCAVHTIVVVVWLVWLTSQTVRAFHLVHKNVNRWQTFLIAYLSLFAARAVLFRHRIMHFASEIHSIIVIWTR